MLLSTGARLLFFRFFFFFSLRVCVGEEEDFVPSVAGSVVTFWLYDDEGGEDDPFPEPVEEEDAELADENVGITEYNGDDTGRGGRRGLGGRISGAGDGDGDGDDVDVLHWLGVWDWGRNFFGDSHREGETEPAMISGRGGSESTAVHALIMGSIGLYGW
jgi:hypothetical protein